MSHSIAWSAKSCTASVFACLLVLPAAVSAQQVGAPQTSVPVVQSIPQKSAGLRLNDALNRLARNPQDVTALGEAGQASLELGDAQAAIGFYRRALTIQPQSARLKAGLAGAYVLGEDPFSAIELFDEAEKAGPIEPERLSDRGLAFDLVGDSLTAQRYYKESLAASPNDETLRRLGLSQAIRKDRKGMDQTLSALLQRQDKAAWRTRAFGLAIMGQVDEAEAIARQNMPTAMAEAITAYFRYMPRLTPAQQASAGNLGRFPRASEIGVDDPRMASYARTPVQVAVATPASAVKPVKGKNSRDSKVGQASPVKPARAVPPPEPQVSRETTSSAGRPTRMAQQNSEVTKPNPAPTLASRPALIVAERPAPQPIVPQAQSVVTAAQPAVAVSQSTIEKTVVSEQPKSEPTQSLASEQPKAVVVPELVPARRPASLDEAFADLAPPSIVIDPKAGAVDVRTVRPVAAAKKPVLNNPGASNPVLNNTADVPEQSAKSLPAKAPSGKALAAKESPARGKAVKDLPAKDQVAKDQPAKGKAAKGMVVDPKAKGAKDAKPVNPKDPKAKDAKDPKGKDPKAKDAKAKPSHPSRIWVQIAAGRNKSALAFDWRKFAKEDPAIFKAQKPYVSDWGQTNRLLTGPFGSAKEAEAFLAKLKKAGRGGAFVWTSPAGQVVDALALGK